MRREDFTSDAPGHFMKTVKGLDAYVPDLLPPRNFALDNDIWRAETIARSELARLDTALPAAEFDPFLATFALVQREAFCTSRMEGTYTTPQDLALFELEPASKSDAGDKESQTREVSNYRVACRTACEALKVEQKITEALIREAHRVLLTGTRGREKHPGEYRATQNFIGKGVDGESARFIPPPPTVVAPGLENLFGFIGTSLREDAQIPPVTSLALIHYQFETIHPFEDGNGRIGRLLIPLILIAGGQLKHPVLHASYTIEKYREDYTNLLLRVSQRGEWKNWIIFFLRMIALAAKDCATLVEKLRNLRNEYRAAVKAPKRSVALRQLIDALFRRPATTINEAMSATGVGFAQTAEHLETLRSLNIVEETTGKQRNRRYLAMGILDVIFGTEP